jgi:hypothetical protein
MTWFPIFQTPDFKRAVEFQTSVLGGGWPGKRNFCGIPRFSRVACLFQRHRRKGHGP